MKGRPIGAWGKFSAERQEWHPLLHHCIDVGACVEALLSLPLVRRRLARLARLQDLRPSQAACLSFLGALHDFGKNNNGFRHKIDEQPYLKAGHVREALSLLRDSALRRRALDALRFSMLESWCGSSRAGLQYLLVTLAHHGRPVEAPPHVDPRIWFPEGNFDPLEEISRLVSTLHASFLESLCPCGPADRLPQEPEFHHAFSGLIMLADWIASDTRLFPFSASLDDDRLALAREAARTALVRLGLDVTNAHISSRTYFPAFGENFPTVSAPRPLQSVVESLDLPGDGSVVIFEAETGSGKTEAAFRYFLRLFAAGQVDGFYFALPTRSAALQISERLYRAACKAFPSERPPLVLAVPGYIRFDDMEGHALPDFHVLWPDEVKDAARGWAAEHPKRYMAAPLVVGTVDQVLLSALKVPHAQLRASALLRHLLVIDEVHASDTYMSTILREVLRYHVNAGGHALLMSATLGMSARHRFLSDDHGDVPDLESAVQTPYPAVWIRTGTHAPQRISPASGDSCKSVTLESAPIVDDVASISALALLEAGRGARVLILRNLVSDAIATHLGLEKQAHGREHLLFHVGPVCTLHHSRFSSLDRKTIDREVVGAFGKGSATGACVLVSTQTIEQSVDVDFDLLITDLCPADVLLQRIGRLHRHAERTRPAGFTSARVIVLVSSNRDLSVFIERKGKARGLARGPHGWGTVYPDLRMLEATWRLIARRPCWDIPAMNRLAVECATHPAYLQSIVSELGGLWREHGQRMEGIRAAHGIFARQNTLRRDLPLDNRSCLFGDGVASEIRTRLGLSDRVVRFAPALRSPFGNPVDELTIPAWMLGGDSSSAEDGLVCQATADAFRFTFSGRAFLYDRLGLRRESDESAEE